MKRGWKIAGIVLALFAILMVLLFAAMMLRFRPTRGTHIPEYPHPRRALLVIDLQKDFLGWESMRLLPDQNDVIERVNLLQQAAAADTMPVIHIRQEFSGPTGKLVSRLFLDGKAMAGSPGVAMDERILPLSDAEFTKSVGDAFSNPALQEYLDRQQVSELILTGMDAQFCVHQTAQGALNRGYRVSIVTDAVLLQSAGKWDKLLAAYRKEGISLPVTGELTGGEIRKAK